MELQSVHIQRFKGIVDAPFDLGKFNVLVGANNSGKSSLIQGLHFAIGLLQTIELNKGWTSKDSVTQSFNPVQVLYSPAENVGALGVGGRLREEVGESIQVTFTLTTGEQPTIAVKKGRNRNIVVDVQQAKAARKLAGLQKPFSVFSPGLAGIAKNEQWVSDGVLLRTIARGDANLVLRNILLRLWCTPEWNGFLADLHEIFDGLEFRVNFLRETDEFITVDVKVKDAWIPLELVGTGVLQATQILSYIHRFSPSLIVLDEPDSHLHPNNQRLLCALLRTVAEVRNVQILLTTHSRHVVDAVSGYANFLWVRNGTVDSVGPDDEIGVLLDIGALDVKERVNQPGTKVVVLTEDEDTKALLTLLSAAGFDIGGNTVVLPYYGVTKTKQLRPLIKIITSNVNAPPKVILHRDRDYFQDDEAENWCTEVRKLNVEPFLTSGTDIESEFLDVNHLVDVCGDASREEIEILLKEAYKQTRESSTASYVNGRIEIRRSLGSHANINHGALAVEGAKKVIENEVRWAHSKTVLRTFRRLYQEKLGKNANIYKLSNSLKLGVLATIYKKTIGSKGKVKPGGA